MAACYRAQQIAHGVFDVVGGRTKDYLQRPKANGYRSLHSTLRLPQEWTAPDGGVVSAPAAARAGGGKIVADTGGSGKGGGGRRVELQVRTAAMHALAEMGAAVGAAQVESS
jgi:GTP pyrophosphokinase